MLAKKSIDDIPPEDFSQKRVFVRVDFNVPIHNGKVTNNLRIREEIPTIKKLLELNAKVILVSHWGRPKGKRSEEFSLRPVFEELKSFLPETKIYFVETLEELQKKSQEIQPKEIILFENIRFYDQEEKNDLEFAKELAKCADIYVNDAFASAHRAHTSTEGVARFVKPAVAGYLMKKELEYLTKILYQPERPFYAILGGAKISDKILVIENLLKIVDKLLIGGAMMFTFLRALGYSTGNSLVEEDRIQVAKEILEEHKDKVILPVDAVVTDFLDMKKLQIGSISEVEVQQIPEGKIGVDIGSKTIEYYKRELSQAKLVFWNGPMGTFEIEQTSKGTFELARALAEITKHGVITIVGGGDSTSAIEKIGLGSEVSHVSTGGGASLEFIEGKVLPGIDVLDSK
ncbi:MAG: phosphoglycerate kinase [Leptospiraceae bacterium]|nr:phosphoglycerate kinase [Leptospiraceae bacterium]MDW7976594.1 phosphoglycerate kinase [Leptospiraceae bacterium]